MATKCNVNPGLDVKLEKKTAKKHIIETGGET